MSAGTAHLIGSFLLVLACSHVSGQTTQTPQQLCASARFDMVFVVDSSGSIGPDNYALVRAFMRRMADLFSISTSPFSGVQIGIVLFGNEGRLALQLSGNRQEINTVIEDHRYLDENTNTSGGIYIAKTEIFDDVTVNRENVQDVMLVLTDGLPTRDTNLTRPYAEELQSEEEDVQMFAIGVTPAVNEETVQYLSSPAQDGSRTENLNYWLLEGFSDLSNDVDGIARVICATINANTFCASDPCQNGGTCREEQTAYCDCVTGYYGPVCELNYCTAPIGESAQCLNGGTCTAEENGFSCACVFGYYGNRCENYVCTADSCDNGDCVAQANDFICDCYFGYYGDRCQNYYCTPNQCLNGGTCNILENGFSCTCANGYWGSICQNEYCASDTCQNGGTCNGFTSGYNCSCVPGYYGTHCELEYCTDPTNPCQNGGTCSLSNSAPFYRCQCTDSYSGNVCIFPVVTTTQAPVQLAGAAASSDKKKSNDDYLIALIVVIILLIVGLLILLLLCCCWSKIYAFCCKPRQKYVAPIVPFYTEKVIETNSASTQCAIAPTTKAEPLKPKKVYRQDMVVVPTCAMCGHAKDNCTCCKICNSPDCCGHHCDGPQPITTCHVCDPVPVPVTTTCHMCHGHRPSCPHCGSAGPVCNHVDPPVCPHHAPIQLQPCPHHAPALSCSQCANFLERSTSGFESVHSSLPLGHHPATLTLQNTAPNRRPTRKARRQRARRRERSEPRDHPTSGMTSDTGSCSSRVLLINHGRSMRRSRDRAGATNGGYTSESDMGTHRSVKKDYVYIPADCPKTTQRDAQTFLNESFRSSRVTAGK